MSRLVPSACAAALLALMLAAVSGSPAEATTRTPPTVFQIVLENSSEATSFPGTGTELDELASQGVFFPNYYATGHNSLDNYVAMASGQAPYSSTSQDCPFYHDGGGTMDSAGFYHPMTPQDVGCVYPAAAKTLADQLSAAGRTWRGYMQDMGNTAGRETSPCGQPALGGVAINPAVGGPDQTQEATSADQYAARHNPFVYFHSLIDTPAGGPSPCATNVVPFTQLASDLASGHVASYNFITPNLCNDGHDSPCKGPGADGNPGAGGLTSANAFLSQVVPEIEASAAYRQGALILITFDESAGDNSSCCGETGQPGIQGSGGGGKVGAIILGARLTPHVSTCAYNHYSLLRTWENLFGLTPTATGISGSDGHGHLAHAGDAGVGSLLPDVRASADRCAS